MTLSSRSSSMPLVAQPQRVPTHSSLRNHHFRPQSRGFVHSQISLFAVTSGRSRPLTRYSDAARTLLSRPERQRRPRLAWVKRDREAGAGAGAEEAHRFQAKIPEGERESRAEMGRRRGNREKGEIDGERDRIQWRC